MEAVARHIEVVREALRAERERVRTPRIEEAAFLPAALEVAERPVSPTLRATAWLLTIGLIATILWLVLGRVDVVATAQGRIIPTGEVKLIQSSGSGTVRAIYVHDGDHVRKGQPLVDLDPTLSGADLAQTQKTLLTVETDVARNRTIADALGGRTSPLRLDSEVPGDVQQTQRRLVQAQLSEVNANVASLTAARASALEDARAARAQADRLARTTPILDQEIAAMNALDAKGYAPGLRLMELQRQRDQEVGDRQVALAQQAKSEEDAEKIARQIADVRETARRGALSDLSKAEGEAIVRREDVVKADRRSRLQRLVSPVDGTVQQLALHTIGGVVEPARTLMVVVPAGTDLEVEAMVLNRDVGFVREGQQVAVKIDAFPFTRFGTVPGVIRTLSRDAVADGKAKATYVARIALSRSTIDVDDRRVGLTAGLAVAADIRTGRRRIISYLLSPLSGRIKDAARER
jgi:hemolysin D